MTTKTLRAQLLSETVAKVNILGVGGPEMQSPPAACRDSEKAEISWRLLGRWHISSISSKESSPRPQNIVWGDRGRQCTELGRDTHARTLSDAGFTYWFKPAGAM